MGRHSAGHGVRRGVVAARLRALLIGGLVFGIGSTLTLAAWTDSEHAKGSFGTSTFGIEGSTNGASFTKHASEGSAATMSFAATGLSPGSIVHAPFDVRTTAASTVAGEVGLAPAVVSGEPLVTENLSYRVATVTTSTTCDSASYTGDAVSPETVFPIPEQTVEAHSGTTIRYCFEVKMSTSTPNTAQGKTGAVMWKFAATSAP